MPGSFIVVVTYVCVIIIIFMYFYYVRYLGYRVDDDQLCEIIKILLFTCASIFRIIYPTIN